MKIYTSQKHRLSRWLFAILLVVNPLYLTKAQAKNSIYINDKPISAALREVERRTGERFNFMNSLLGNNERVSVSLTDATTEEMLSAIFRNKPEIRWMRTKSTITLYKQGVDVLEETEPTVSGTITDSLNNPLAGVSITNKRTNDRKTTGADGRFTISGVKGDVLQVTSIGFNSDSYIIKDGGSIVIRMKASMNALQETVVKGYYAVSKELNTGNVGVLKAADIAKQPVGDPILALIGRIPGLNVVQTSGATGAYPEITIRGINSVASGRIPFFIVDGVPFDAQNLARASNAASADASPFLNIRPDDIERIEVLKDADATAIYGSRGANGVILITTKKGIKGDSKIDLIANRGYSRITRRFDLMDTKQYLEMRNEAFKNDIATPGTTAHDLNGNWGDINQYTDWQKLLIGETAHSYNGALSFTGGNANTQFRAGGTYRKEGSVYAGDYDNEIISGSLRASNTSLDRRLSVDFSVNYSKSKVSLPITNLTTEIFAAPNTPQIYNSDGSLNFSNSTFANPFALLRRRSENSTDNLNTNANVSYRMVDNLKATINLGYNKRDYREQNTTPFSSFDPTTTNPETRRQKIIGTGDIKTWIIEPQLAYQAFIRNHTVDILVGSSFQEEHLDKSYMVATGFSSDASLRNTTVATSLSLTATDVQYKYAAAFARLGYNYAGKYIINLTGRRDGSTRFGPQRQFGTFGAVGTAWLFSKERFIAQSQSFLSFGKLRGSIGTTGNDQIEDYAFLSAYTSTSRAYQGMTTLNPLRPENAQYGWETIKKMELALELGFLKDRITLNSSVYKNRTDNQLVGYPLSTITGFTTIQANLPAVIDNKGIEFELSATILQRNKLTWTTNANLSILRTKLVAYPDIKASSYSTRYSIGMPLDVSFLYQFKEIDTQKGIYTFVDQNKDGNINSPLDKKFYSRQQKFVGGLGNTLTYRNVSFDIFIQYVKQPGLAYLYASTPGGFAGNGINQQVALLDRWQKPGDKARFQKFTQVLGSEARTASTQYNESSGRISDASFMRIKNIAISWTTPPKWKSKKIPIMRAFVQAQNLLTLTHYEGLDPETQGNALAPLASVNIGIQITL